MDQILFGPFRLDLASSRLFREDAPVALRPQAFTVLRVLLQSTGREIDHQQMIRDAWHGTTVSHHTIAVTVAEVRRALEEYGSWITYRPKLGYKLETAKSDDHIRKGWHFCNLRTRDGFERGIECFQRAAIEDEADHRGVEGLAFSYLTLGTCGMRPPLQMYPAFQAAHRRAVELSGWTPELRSDHGHALHLFERRLAEAESALLQSHREKPKQPTMYVRLPMLYASLGKLDDALEILLEAQAADSLMPMLPATEVNIRFCRREFDAAVACGRHALELHPYLQMARVFYAQALEYSGRLEEALAQYRLACVISPDLLWLRALEGTCLGRHGRQDEASAILEEIEKIRLSDYVDAYYMALLLDSLGQRAAAFEELERAFQENSTTLPILLVDPKMDALRKDRRFRTVAEKLFPEKTIKSAIA